MSVMSDQIRRNFKAGDDKRDEGLMTPEDIIRFDTIQYGEDPEWQVLDVYRPRDTEGSLPVIVSVHGGGWVYGDKERYQFYGMNLAERGFAVVNFTYRLAPEYKFPAPLEDTNQVFAWVLDHADEYGFDTGNIFAVGDSAGGNCLGLYAAVCTNPEYRSSFSFEPPEGFAPKAIALNCGMYRLETDGEQNAMNRELMADYLPERGTPEELWKIRVVNHVTANYPPVYLMTAAGDFLKEQAVCMTEKLIENNVPFELHFYGDSEHEYGHVFHCNIKLQAAKTCNDEECEFFRKYCG